MPMTATDNLAIARRYLEALESGAEGSALAEFFTKDVVQEEFPNRLSPIGAHRDLAALLDAAKKGKKTLRAQKYDILNTIVDGDSVALEIVWRGYLAPAGGHTPGGFRRCGPICRCGWNSATARSRGSTTTIASIRGGSDGLSRPGPSSADLASRSCAV